MRAGLGGMGAPLRSQAGGFGPPFTGERRSLAETRYEEEVKRGETPRVSALAAGGGGGGWLSLAVHSWPRPHSHCPFGSSVIFSATTVNCYSLRQAG